MISDIITTRRSIYPNQYNNHPISREEIQKILEVANWAPTHKRTEPWRFKVFHSENSRLALSTFLAKTYRETTDKFSEIKLRNITEKALLSQCVIAICMQRDPKETVPEWEEVASVAMAVQNMWLTATEMSIGAYWSSPSLMNYLGEHITLNEGEKCLGFFYMGKYEGALIDGIRKSSIEEKTIWR